MLQRAFHRHIDGRSEARRPGSPVRESYGHSSAGYPLRPQRASTCVTAAEFILVLTVRIHRGGELAAATLGLFGIAVFSDELHAAAPAAAAARAPDWATSKNLERGLGLRLIDLLKRETHVDHDPVAGLRILDETDVDVLSNAAGSAMASSALRIFRSFQELPAHINGP